MLSSGTERRLAAVLSADVVGYTRLMHADEDGTHVRMMALRHDVVDPNVTIHAGRIVKSTGDGILAEFPSAVEAVVCAVEIQQLMATRNRSLPEPERIVFRFGLNMGEVIIEPDDIYGDAVNIAVRLQGIAPAGGLCVSQVVFDQVQHGLSFSLADYGPKSLKNISASIHAFGLEAEQIALLPESSLSTATNGSSRLAAPSNAAARHLAKRLSIAVLPFIDESGDKSQEYFCDGMVEEIITALSHFRSLFVIARNSSFLYRNRILDSRQIARELGVRYLVEGSIQRAADRVRIRANLIDTESGGHLWADRFDGDFTDVFSLQDRVATRIVTAIEPRVLQSEIEKARRKPAESLDAYDYYLHALPLRLALSAEATDEALRLLNKAIALDPSYAPALAHAASCHLALQDQGWKVLTPDEVAEGLRLARAAIDSDSNDAVALCLSGHTIAGLTGDYDAGLTLIDRAILLNPSYAEAWMRSGMVRVYSGDLQTAIEHAQRSMELSPLDPKLYHPLCAQGYALLFLGNPQAAEEAARRALTGKQKPEMAFRILITALIEQQKLEEARTIAASFLKHIPGFRIAKWRSRSRFARDSRFDSMAVALQSAGLPE